jgi:membrane protein
MTSLWARGGLTLKELGLRLWRQIFEDELLGRCAELAYFFLFSIFPLLLFLTTLIGTLAEANPALELDLTVFLIRISPSPQISNLLTTTLQEVTRGSTGTKLWLSLATAIWISSNGMIAVGRTLNIACGLKETRRWWRRRIISILLTIVFSALILSALGLFFYGGVIARALGERLAPSGVGGFIAFAWRVLQWVLILVFSGISFEMVYNYAPNLGKSPNRPWGTPGAVVGVALWLLATLGLRTYLAYFHIYTTTYGSLGAVILLLVWFYLTAFALLMGGEVNSEIGKEITRLKGEAEAKETEEARGAEEEEPELVGAPTVPRRA